MGKMLKVIKEEKLKIELLNQTLDKMYDHQSINLGEGLQSDMLKSYPKMIHEVKENIKKYKKNVEELKKTYEQSRTRLNILLGEVGFLQKMKEGYEEEQKRKFNRKKEEEVEDIINMRRANG